MAYVARTMRAHQGAFALLLGTALFFVNLAVSPSFVAGGQIAATLGTAAPLAIAAMASTPAFLSGRGGIDLSIAPLMGFINIILVTGLLGTSFGSPALAVPLLLALGAAIGALSGLLVAWLRIPPVLATLAMFFVLSGVDLRLVPDPVGTHGTWADSLAGSVGPIPGAAITVGVPLLAWLGLRRSAYVETLLAVGDDDATALSAGVNVAAVRVSAYALGGCIAAIGGIALTGLIRSADAITFQPYVLLALAAVALGGNNLAGGRGGLGLAGLGAVSIFLLEILLDALNVPANYIQTAYGGALLTAVVIGALIVRGGVPRT